MTLTGENAFGLKQQLDLLVNQFLHEHGDLALERLDGEESDFLRISEALTSLPFLANKKMVVLSRGSANKKFVEVAEKLLNELPETTELIIVEPKLDKRSSYYKFLKKQTDFQEHAPLDAGGISRWLVIKAKEQGGTISLRDAQYLVERVGLSQQLLAIELDKLLLYSNSVSHEVIDLLTEAAPQSTVFQLLESAFAGRTEQALRLYDEQRAQNVEPPQIVAMLAWQLHVLALIKTGNDRGADTIAAEAKLSPYVVRKSLTIANRLSASEVRRLVADLLQIDLRSKRQSIDIDDALKNYLLKLSTY